jgi:hypothetical protein
VIVNGGGCIRRFGASLANGVGHAWLPNDAWWIFFFFVILTSLIHHHRINAHIFLRWFLIYGLFFHNHSSQGRPTGSAFRFVAMFRSIVSESQ